MRIFRAELFRLQKDREAAWARSRFVQSRLIRVGDNNFASLGELDMEAEFLTNESGEVDLCIWREGQLVHYGYCFAGKARSD